MPDPPTVTRLPVEVELLFELVLTPLPRGGPALLADGSAPAGEKRTRLWLLDGITERAAPVAEVWAHTDDRED
ncbi:hypothetical protein [Embleya sp. NPDC005575]|uniref:hypothetical protein n=1 Tax=Embleya sp. NPDC005575 TaxID=3156892 RepID=UPI0033AF1CE1